MISRNLIAASDLGIQANMTFDGLGLSPDLLRAVADAGYEQPTPIQEQAIPLVLAGRDLIGVAQTGTGKTAGFTLPMIEALAKGRARARMPRSLILEPTRELAAQVAENFETYGKYHKLSMALLIGGVAFGDQDAKLDRGVDVVIATPGRLLDQFERGKILLADIKILVVDEADRMLDMGFIPDVERIINVLPRRRQTLMFSATMPPEVRRLADTYLTDPQQVEVARPATTAENVIQTLIDVPESPAAKRQALRDLLDSEEVRNAIIFCNRKRDVTILNRSLRQHDYDASELHGDMAQSVRTETLERFKNGEITLLVASDVAARGLDVEDMSHVFNFDVPIHADDYVHRVGRTGRAGREGRAFTLVTPADGKYVAAIERLTGSRLDRRPAAGYEPAPAPAQAAEPAPARTRGRRRPAAKRAERSDVKPADIKPAERPPERQAERKAERPTDRGRRRRRDEDAAANKGDEVVVGMGDHTPAFLLR